MPKSTIPDQPDGFPRGKHIQGFKGMKSTESCSCGGCHPNAQKNKGKVKWIVPKNTHLVG